MSRRAVAIAFGAAMFATSAGASAQLQVARNMSLDQTESVADGASEEWTVRGSATSTFDGATFDAAHDLFDFAAGGLAVRSIDADGTAHLVANGDAPACRAAHVAAPCLVPRISVLAHTRLQSEHDFAATLRGSTVVTSLPPPPAPMISRETIRSLVEGAGVTALALGALLGIFFVRARRRSPFGEVCAAAREAHGRTKDDPTLAMIHAKIDPLVARARDLEAARVACANKLREVDVSTLERRRASLAASPDAADALAAIDVERAEAARLKSDFDASIAGLARIASALRTISLAARSGRNVRVRTKADLVDDVTSELAMRDDAIAEVD